MNAVLSKRKLGSIFDFKNGRSFKKTEWSEDGLPIIRIQNLNKPDAPFNYFCGDYDQAIEVNEGDLLFSWSGTVGSSFGAYIWSRDKAVLNQHIFRVTVSDGIDKKYAYYALKEITAEIEKQVSGAVGLVHITKTKLKEFEIPVPPLADQHRVVAILDEAFEGIATTTANAEQNLKNARELFDAALMALLTNGEESWPHQPLSSTCIVERGSSPRPIKSYLTDGEDGVNWIKIGDTKGINKYIDSTRQKITKEGAKRSRKVVPGDFILTNSMSYGKPYIMATEGYVHDGWFILRLNDGIDTDFFYHLLSSRVVQDQFQSLAAGAVVKNISGDLVKKAILPIPPIKEQLRIVSEIEILWEQTYRLEAIYQQKLDALAELKQSLLQKAFAGELH